MDEMIWVNGYRLRRVVISSPERHVEWRVAKDGWLVNSFYSFELAQAWAEGQP